jgi:hypothetical protein
VKENRCSGQTLDDDEVRSIIHGKLNVSFTVTCTCPHPKLPTALTEIDLKQFDTPVEARYVLALSNQHNNANVRENERATRSIVDAK